MKNLHILIVVISTFIIYSCSNDSGSVNDNSEEIIVVANRGNGSVSFINAITNKVEKTIEINNSEPMYAVYVKSFDKLYIGDRKQSKVHIINPQTKIIESSIDVGKGVYHMWADGTGRRLWVNGDIDKSISVIDLQTKSVIKTIYLDLKPHDVFISKDGKKAYVSVIDENSNSSDKIYMFDALSFEKIKEAIVGKDPHVYHLETQNALYVPCQSGHLFNLDGNNLNQNSLSEFEGSHGVFPSPDEKIIFVSNLPGGELYSVKSSDNTLTTNPLKSIEKIPHNITVNNNGSKVFVTHSGKTAEKVSIYKVKDNGELNYIESITTGTNPFGIAYYKRDIN